MKKISFLTLILTVILVCKLCGCSSADLNRTAGDVIANSGQEELILADTIQTTDVMNHLSENMTGAKWNALNKAIDANFRLGLNFFQTETIIPTTAVIVKIKNRSNDKIGDHVSISQLFTDLDFNPLHLFKKRKK